MRSSNASAPCRFELRPSRWLVGMMSALALLAPWSVLVSEMPRWAAWPIAIAAAVIGLGLARREWSRPVVPVLIRTDGRAEVDGHAVDDFAWAWRGPVAFLSWRAADGRTQRRSLWPDTLDGHLRRELRLIMRNRSAVRGNDPMAP